MPEQRSDGRLRTEVAVLSGFRTPAQGRAMQQRCAARWLLCTRPSRKLCCATGARYPRTRLDATRISSWRSGQLPRSTWDRRCVRRCGVSHYLAQFWRPHTRRLPASLAASPRASIQAAVLLQSLPGVRGEIGFLCADACSHRAAARQRGHGVGAHRCPLLPRLQISALHGDLSSAVRDGI